MGWDVRQGMAIARGTFLCVIDSDGQIPPASVVECLLKAEREGLDLVKTYRTSRDDGCYRQFLSFAYNTFFRVLFGSKIHDINSKPKIIRRDKYELLQIEFDDWFVDAEIVLQASDLGFKIGELPIHFAANKTRASLVRPEAIFEFVANLLKYRLLGRRRRISSASRSPAKDLPTAQVGEFFGPAKTIHETTRSGFILRFTLPRSTANQRRATPGSRPRYPAP